MLVGVVSPFNVCVYMYMFPINKLWLINEYQTWSTYTYEEAWMFITINIQSRFVEKFPDGLLHMSEGVY